MKTKRKPKKEKPLLIAKTPLTFKVMAKKFGLSRKKQKEICERVEAITEKVVQMKKHIAAPASAKEIRKALGVTRQDEIEARKLLKSLHKEGLHKCRALKNKKVRGLCLDTIYDPYKVSIVVCRVSGKYQASLNTVFVRADISVDNRGVHRIPIQFCPFCGEKLADEKPYLTRANF